jgi:hypothetical protein
MEQLAQVNLAQSFLTRGLYLVKPTIIDQLV